MEPLLDELPDGLKRWAPPPRRLRYARCGSAGAFDLPRVVLEEEWGAPERQGDRVVFRRTTREVGAQGPGRVIEDALVGYGPDGLVDLGVFVDGGFSPYEPPQVVLPGNPVVGARWSAEHARGERKSKRTVERWPAPAALPAERRRDRRPEGTSSSGATSRMARGGPATTPSSRPRIGPAHVDGGGERHGPHPRRPVGGHRHLEGLPASPPSPSVRTSQRSTGASGASLALGANQV